MKRCMLNVPKQTSMLIGCLLVLPSCTHKSHIIKKEICTYPIEALSFEEIDKQVPTHNSDITVFIHGTKLLMRSSYYKHFGGKPRLKQACAFSPDTKIDRLLKQLSFVAPDMFPYDNLYCFGWSGKLSVKERNNVTHVLYDQLVEISHTYYLTHRRKPTICLICHSHGGNIALSLACIHAQKQKNLTIDALITLACPVQLSTKNFVDCPLFKQVYSFYSTFDFVQVIAPEIVHYVHNEQGELICKKPCWFPFSSRRFDERPHVKQARIKMNKHAVLHSCFTKADFLQTLPQLMHAVDDAYTHQNQTVAPHKKEVLCAITSRKINAQA